MNETLILSEFRAVFKKSMKTEAVFTKTEMNNEWDVVLEIQAVLKKHSYWSCIYQDIHLWVI